MALQITIEDNKGNVVGFMGETVDSVTKAVQKTVRVLATEKRFHRSKSEIVNPDSLGIPKGDIPTWIGTKPVDELIDAELLPSLSPVEEPAKSEAETAMEILTGKVQVDAVRSVESPKTQ